ncbi:uncharacterized protein LOC113359501 [Papaver somniferum]|uniref:uncharacterized protein LOC113359501 n=1 Tax=Papaver somniferum TaxID=3469 RepID=UPI000E704FFC|nr:uncharacterized protein LOC113359501 [Papaver somniferum]
MTNDKQFVRFCSSANYLGQKLDKMFNYIFAFGCWRCRMTSVILVPPRTVYVESKKERAKQQCIPETEKEEKLVTSYQGIYKQFVETMRSLNVAVIGTVGKPFDPSFREAITREESQQFREAIIIQEVHRGFPPHGDLVLQPAKVKVKPTTTAEESSKTVTAGLDESSNG